MWQGSTISMSTLSSTHKTEGQFGFSHDQQALIFTWAYQCNHCERTYHYKRNLSYHLRHECGREAQFQCPFCSHRTKHKRKIAIHIQKKHPTGFFTSFESDGGKTLKEQALSLSGASVCPNCGKIFRYHSTLSRHMRYVCGKDPQFQCPHCPLRTKFKCNLLSHISNKHGIKQ